MYELLIFCTVISVKKNVQQHDCHCMTPVMTRSLWLKPNCVFAIWLSPDLDAETLRSYLTEKLGKSVTCRKIDTTHK